jgi:hypothetical protein
MFVDVDMFVDGGYGCGLWIYLWMVDIFAE